VFTLSHKLLLSSCRSRTRISSSARTGKSLSKLHLIKNNFFHPLKSKLLYIGYKKQMILTFIVSLCIAHSPAPNRVLCYHGPIMIIKDCKICNKSLKFFKTYKLCANLGCTEYNKKLRRYDVQEDHEKEKVKFQEEE